jgi:ABC-2 type transport system permease protein
VRAALVIAWREYKQYILSRGFLVFLIMMPVAAVVGGALLGVAQGARPARSFVIVDETGRFAASLAAEIERREAMATLAAWDAWLALAATGEALESDRIPPPFAPGERTRARADAFQSAGIEAARAAAAPHLRPGAPAFPNPRAAFRLLATPGDVAAAPDLATARERLRPYLLGESRLAGERGPLFAALLIPRGFSEDPESPEAEFWSRNVTDGALKSALSRALSYELRRQAAETMGLAAGALDAVVDIDASLAEFRPDRPSESAALSEADRLLSMLPALLTYMLVVIVFSAGQLLLTNTIEERSNKIVEVLLSSVTADQLMMGKFIGIAAVGLTLPTVFGVTAVVVTLLLGGAEGSGAAISAIFGSGLIVVYLFYFFCAYLIFGMIFLAIGAISNSLQDAQSYMGPVMILVFLPLPFALMVYENPNGIIASILTWIPIYTPYAVMMRAAADPPLLEIAGATALMLLFAYGLTRAMGRIFREAILNSAPSKFRDVLRILRGGAGAG